MMSPSTQVRGLQVGFDGGVRGMQRHDVRWGLRRWEINNFFSPDFRRLDLTLGPRIQARLSLLQAGTLEQTNFQNFWSKH